MRFILFLVSALGSIAGAIIVASMSNHEHVTHQQLAVIIGIAFAVIPYCLARSWQELQRTRWEKNLPAEIGLAVADALNERQEPVRKETAQSQYLLKK